MVVVVLVLVLVVLVAARVVAAFVVGSNGCAAQHAQTQEHATYNNRAVHTMRTDCACQHVAEHPNTLNTLTPERPNAQAPYAPGTPERP